MQEKVNQNKIRNLMNMSYQGDAADSFGEYPQPFTKKIEDMNFHLQELLDQEAQYQNDPTNPDQLRSLLKQIKFRIGRVKTDSFHIGRLLDKVKEIVGHGEFKKSIEEYCGISYSLANKLMNVYYACRPNPQWAQTLKISVVYELCAPGTPEDLRKLLFEEGDNDKLTDKKVRKVKKLWKAGLINEKSPEIKALCRLYTDEDEYEKFKKETNDYLNQLGLLRNSVCSAAENLKPPTFQGRDKI
jgi:hypothetical protein